jgi:hypothetical protein
MDNETTRAILVIVGTLAVAGGLYVLDVHSYKRFQYKFFTLKSFSTVVAGIVFLILGIMWRLHAEKVGQDQSGGIALIGAAGCVLWWVLFRNITKTNLLVGLGGSIVQVVLFAVLAYVGIFTAILSVIFVGVIIAFIQPVYIVNRGSVWGRPKK